MDPGIKPTRHLLLSLGSASIRNITITRIWSVMNMPLLHMLITSMRDMVRRAIIQRMMSILETLSTVNMSSSMEHMQSMLGMEDIVSTADMVGMLGIMQTCSSVPSGSH